MGDVGQVGHVGKKMKAQIFTSNVLWFLQSKQPCIIFRAVCLEIKIAR
jgi:hypothetical protein